MRVSGWLISRLSICVLMLGAAAPPLSFTPVEPRFAAGSAEYAAIWASDGQRIVAVLEETTGLAFPEAPIDVIVSDGRPMTSFDGRTIRLRASYSPDYKKATVVHELGHRLAMILPHPSGRDDHRLLYLFLYDAWTSLYGRDFADRMVAIERRIPGRVDYAAAWDWALALGRDERQARLRALRTRGDASEWLLDNRRQPPISGP